MIVKFQSLAVPVLVDMATPWPTDCNRICCGPSAFIVVSRAAALVPKKFPSHSATWNDVDMNCFSTPFTPTLVSAVAFTTANTSLTIVSG